jgi:hypothetical protein
MKMDGYRFARDLPNKVLRGALCPRGHFR